MSGGRAFNSKRQGKADRGGGLVRGVKVLPKSRFRSGISIHSSYVSGVLEIQCANSIAPNILYLSPPPIQKVNVDIM
jgi:hypothetical protein